MSYSENCPNESTQMTDSNASSWLGGWFQAAKEKSLSAVNMVKKDLAEFTSTMQHDTTRIAGEVKTRVMQESASSATQKVKDGMNNLIDGLSKALSTDAGADITTAKKSLQKDAVFNRSKARLRAIQIDPDTYIHEPGGEKEVFMQWAATFDVEKKKDEIAELLVSNVEVRSLYTQLVPMQVKHIDFWQRYFYKVHQLRQDEERRAQLFIRVDRTHQQNADGDWEPGIDWDDIEGPNSPVNEDAPEVLLTPTLESDTAKANECSSSTEDDKHKDAVAKSLNRLTLSELQCPVGDAASDSETSQANSLSSKVTSSFATVTSSSSPSTQSAGLEDMECTSSETDEPVTPTVKAAEHAVASDQPSPTVCADVVTTVESSDVQTSDDCAEILVASAEPLATANGKESNGEDDWEKEFDVGASSDAELHNARTLTLPQTTGTGAEPEDWENWE